MLHGLHFQNVSTLEADLFFLGGGFEGFSTTRMEEGAKILQRVDVQDMMNLANLLLHDRFRG